MRYVILLRGINVGGHKKILMADLRKLLLKNGLKNVRTYIQSGNVVFDSDEKTSILSKNISTYIYKEYQFEVPVQVYSQSDWGFIMNNNPYLKGPSNEIKSLHVTLLNKIPSEQNIETLKMIDFNPDTYVINNNIIYSNYYNGVGRSKMTINIFEKKLKVKATSRNWNTVSKIMELLSN